MRIATWNINSVRLRAGLVCQLIQEHQPDIICLQETKCPPGQFPSSQFSEIGYGHIAENGCTGHHGVAIISKLPFEDMSSRAFCGKQDGRHVSIRPTGTNITIHSIYVPAGGDEPDPAINDKFAHKLSFLDEMQNWTKDLAGSGDHIFTGDLNVAPYENDVWSHKQLLKVVSHTPIETEKLLSIMDGAALHDPIRATYPEPEKLYSWWSYRSRDWSTSDRGRRLDHIWVTQGLADKCDNARILKEIRGWERPSDHAPVIVDIR